MPVDQNSSPNLLIRLLDPEIFTRIQPALERVHLERGLEIVPPGEVTQYAYFPEGGVISIVVLSRADDIPTEVGLFGRDGVSSLPALLGSPTTSFSTVVQIDEHSALRIEIARLREEMDRDPVLRGLILRFVHVMMFQMAMSAAAYSHHLLEARLSRWLLMCRDRLDGDDLLLTHEFMSQMLGARRSSVTVTLHVLEGIGAIRADRGVVHISDRRKLEELAGDTYGPAESEYRRLIGNFASGDALTPD